MHGWIKVFPASWSLGLGSFSCAAARQGKARLWPAAPTIPLPRARRPPSKAALGDTPPHVSPRLHP